MMHGETSAGLKFLKCKVYLLFGGASLVYKYVQNYSQVRGIANCHTYRLLCGW